MGRYIDLPAISAHNQLATVWNDPMIGSNNLLKMWKNGSYFCLSVHLTLIPFRRRFFPIGRSGIGKRKLQLTARRLEPKYHTR